jgi:hypothetical protein
MDAPLKLTENGLCRFISLAHYDAGFTERPSHHPYLFHCFEPLPRFVFKLRIYAW